MLLTIFFDDQYWVAVVEWQAEDRLRAARHIFGTEPGMAEVFAFVLYELDGLIQQASADDRIVGTALLDQQPGPHRSPKRRLREAARALDQRGASSAAQEALRLELEARKQERRAQNRVERLAEQERKYRLAREKARQRHRGR